MDIRIICTNCLQGIMENGRCTSCGKSIREHPPRPKHALPEGYVLNERYLIGSVLGRGGFGITYLARDIGEDRRVVVKELYPYCDVRRKTDGVEVVPVAGQGDYFEKCRQRFRGEALLLAGLSEESDAVRVYEAISCNQTEYYSMEYLSGWDLGAFAEEKGKVSWEELSEYVKCVLRALDSLHEKKLIHRDISPDNIFLTGKTKAKLIDYGAARCFADGRGLTAILKQVYAPIEQYYSDGDQGPWTDIYALSATMYHVMTGKKPAAAPSRTKNPERDPVTPMDEVCPEIPAEVAGAIMKGMAVWKEGRFQNVREMAAALWPGEDIFRQETAGRTFQCTAGFYRGQVLKIPVDSEMTVGRSEQCGVSYPQDARGISRTHLSVRCDEEGNLFLRDESTFGTFLSGERMRTKQWYPVEKGATVHFAGETWEAQ